MLKKSKIGGAWFISIAGGLLFLFSVFLIFREEAERGRTRGVPATHKAKMSARSVAESAGTHDGRLTPDFKNIKFNGEKISAKPPDGGNAERVVFDSGDIYARYGGGRDEHPSNTPESKDRRLWLDVRLPFEVSLKLKIYGASTVTLGDTDAASISDYAKNYGIGGGLGFTYQLTPTAELDFDYRHTIPIDERNDNPATNSAGISLRVKF